ncbi:hypothetical protein DM826_07235 [Halonotius aquaticus]|uniref:Uncharacterized protein n=1 Tax=Halonotius aquaticus TaxID=2216978 RepID=A0A3A6Q1R0_9EURY|nr:hypothetical protein DM826_07235 [Halonotius aquaticus]
MPPQTSIPTYGGDRADVRHLERTESGPRVKVSHDDREWICVVDVKSGEVNVEIGRQDGSPADLETPDWLTDNLSHLATPA